MFNLTGRKIYLTLRLFLKYLREKKREIQEYKDDVTRPATCDAIVLKTVFYEKDVKNLFMTSKRNHTYDKYIAH